MENMRVGRSLVFANPRGGVGKTTVAFLSTILMATIKPPRDKKKYVYVEMDFGAESATKIWDASFKVEGENTLKDYLLDKCEIEDIAYTSSRNPVYRNIAFIPAGKITDVKLNLFAKYEMYVEKLDELMDFLWEKSEKIVIDCPGSGGLNYLRDYLLILPLGDSFIPVVEPDIPSIDSANSLIDLAMLMNLNYPLFIFNKYEKKYHWILEEAKRKLRIGETQQPFFTVRFDKKIMEYWSKLELKVNGCKAVEDVKKFVSYILELPEEFSKPTWKAKEIFKVIKHFRAVRRLQPEHLLRKKRSKRSDVSSELEILAGMKEKRFEK